MTAAALSEPARLLAAVDAYQAMTEPRPYREAHSPQRAAEILGREAGAGRLDANSVTAVLEAAGHRGLGISTKTADHHVRTPTPRSASRRGQRPHCSPWSTDLSDGENIQ